MRLALPSERPAEEKGGGKRGGTVFGRPVQGTTAAASTSKGAAMTSIVSHQTVRLRRGKHASPEKGVCVMELASMLAGEPFSDRPQAVCPVIGAYLRSYNDVVDDDRRQDLYRYASEAIDTAGTAALRRRRAERCLTRPPPKGPARGGPPARRGPRAGGCLAEIARLHDQRSRVRRWLSGRPELSLPGSSIELERVGMHLARALQRSGPEGHARALELADELIAMGPVPAAPEIPRRPPRREPART